MKQQPVTYTIIDGVILVVFLGRITDADLLGAQHDMFHDAAFRGRYPRLIDATGVTHWEVTQDMVKHVAKCAVDRGLRRAALVSNHKDFVHGMMLLYATYAGPAVVEVFKNRAVAADWLDGRYQVP